MKRRETRLRRSRCFVVQGLLAVDLDEVAAFAEVVDDRLVQFQLIAQLIEVE
ncbi:MAG: hypothetical protein Q7U82_01565 [Gammaproteobacteria bacterium]|nr:hypothetical protein [Gammaproteobacteria bacterium]